MNWFLLDMVLERKVLLTASPPWAPLASESAAGCGGPAAGAESPLGLETQSQGAPGAGCRVHPPNSPHSPEELAFAHLVLEEESGLRGAALAKHTMGGGALVPSGAVGNLLPQFTDVDVAAQSRRGVGGRVERRHLGVSWEALRRL